LRSLPSEASTVANWYKQNVYDQQIVYENVYDQSEQKIGEIGDVLVDKDGKISAFIVSVGGFLGMDEKHIAMPFNTIHGTRRNDKWWLTMNATKGALKSAQDTRRQDKSDLGTGVNPTAPKCIRIAVAAPSASWRDAGAHLPLHRSRTGIDVRQFHAKFIALEPSSMRLG